MIKFMRLKDPVFRFLLAIWISLITFKYLGVLSLSLLQVFIPLLVAVALELLIQLVTLLANYDK